MTHTIESDISLAILVDFWLGQESQKLKQNIFGVVFFCYLWPQEQKIYRVQVNCKSQGAEISSVPFQHQSSSASLPLLFTISENGGIPWPSPPLRRRRRLSLSLTRSPVVPSPRGVVRRHQMAADAQPGGPGAGGRPASGPSHPVPRPGGGRPQQVRH